jgi:hypothetical protein
MCESKRDKLFLPVYSILLSRVGEQHVLKQEFIFVDEEIMNRVPH